MKVPADGCNHTPYHQILHFWAVYLPSHRNMSPVAAFFLLMQHYQRQRREAEWAYRLSKDVRGHEINFPICALQFYAACTVFEEQGLFLITTRGWSVKAWYHRIPFKEKAWHGQNMINQSSDVPALTEGLTSRILVVTRHFFAFHQWQTRGSTSPSP